MQKNISTRQLRAFIALVETRHFTRAAATCHLSQPAFSALIRQLEEELGLRLFDRSTRHVDLTADGVDFELSARRLVADFDTALDAMTQRATRQRGRVSIALLPSLAADWLPDVLASFHLAYPGIELQVTDVLSEHCIERVRTGQADFALAATRADTAELSAEPFCEDEFHLVCPAGHPLAKRRNIAPRDLANWPFIHLSRTSSVRQYLDAELLPQSLPSVLEVDQLATVSGMVRAGLGISIVPALSLYQFQHPELSVIPLRWPGFLRHIYLVRRRDKGLTAAAQTFHEWVVARKPKLERSRGSARRSIKSS